MKLPDQAVINDLVSTALREDVGSGDLTAALIAADTQISARLICRQEAVLCGVAWVVETCRQVDTGISIAWEKQDGDALHEDDLVCTFSGPARAILTAERTAINLLQTLSGTALAASVYANEVAGTQCRILDTRKTLPGMRMAQKYAVVIGGAHNHRIGLFDGILIKENHIASAGSVTAAVKAAIASAPQCDLVEVEVESLAQLSEALSAGATRIMLDNFDLQMMREGVSMNAGRAELEVSGDVTLKNVREIAETGVEYISVGAITKHVTAVDFSLRVDNS